MPNFYSTDVLEVPPIKTPPPYSEKSWVALVCQDCPEKFCIYSLPGFSSLPCKSFPGTLKLGLDKSAPMIYCRIWGGVRCQFSSSSSLPALRVRVNRPLLTGRCNVQHKLLSSWGQ